MVKRNQEEEERKGEEERRTVTRWNSVVWCRDVRRRRGRKGLTRNRVTEREDEGHWSGGWSMVEGDDGVESLGMETY